MAHVDELPDGDGDSPRRILDIFEQRQNFGIQRIGNVGSGSAQDVLSGLEVIVKRASRNSRRGNKVINRRSIEALLGNNAQGDL
jgi:hypothetical protein